MTVMEKLTKLRKRMKEENIQAYVVGTEDFHGSEYVGDYFKARAYLSGFTGSAGTLVVLDNEAALWTDGRYFLQAGQQLADSGVDLMKIGQPGVQSIPKFLGEKLAEGANVGFDGRTVTCAFVEGLDEVLAEKNINYIYKYDLVDDIWEDRPEISKEPVWELDVKYAGMAREDKIKHLREIMKEYKTDTFVMSALDEIAWLLNLRGHDVLCNPVFLAYMVVRTDEIALYLDENKVNDEIRGKLRDSGVSILPYNQIYDDLKNISITSNVLIDSNTVNYMILKSIPENVNIVDKKSPIQLMKAIKTKTEYENEKIAHIKDGVAVTKFIYWLKKNVGKEKITEISAAEKLLEFRKAQQGFIDESFTPIMGYGKHGAIVHYSATEESDIPLEPRSFLLADTGGHYIEGTTDITRTIALGPLTDEEKRCFTLVLMGNLNLGDAKFLYGVSGTNLDYIARQPLWENGLDYNHGTGHGVGYLLNVHEGPQTIRYQSRAGFSCTPLEEGMITSNEPGLYIENKFGIRHENLVLCVKAEKNQYGQFMKFETLTMVPFDLDAIYKPLMTQKQIDLLNDYHRQVYKNISPYMTDEEKEWLKEATREI